MPDQNPHSRKRTSRPSRRPCPICGKPAVARFRPFCSARCQTIDLARWIGGTYRVPAVEDDMSSDDSEDDR